jgi:UDP-N-acetylglucosamine 3-dehydrogenase
MTEVRIGIAGCGRVARFHLEGYRRCGGRVTAVTDPDPKRAAAWAAELGAAAFPDVAALVTSGLVDALDICSPPGAHLANFAAAAPHVPFIFLEKPMAATLEQAHAILQVARETGVRTMTGFFHRFHEPLLRLKALIDAGTLGRVVTFRNRFMITADADGSRPWLWDRQTAGGGVMVHTASHSLDLFRFMVGEIATVQAALARVDPSVPLEDAAVVTVRSGGGVFGLLEAYGNAPFTDYTVEVQGTEAEARVGYFPPGLTIRERGTEQWNPVPVGETEPHHRIYRGIGAFVQAVRTGGPMSPGLAEGLAAMELVAAAYRTCNGGGSHI